MKKNRWTAQCQHGIDSPGLRPYIAHLFRPRSRSVACCHAQPADCALVAQAQQQLCPALPDPHPPQRGGRPPLRPPRPSFYRRLKNLLRLSQADPSVALWDAAYDSLRDDARSSALVAAYEGTITLQLPGHLRLFGAMNSSLLAVPRQQRAMLMATITQVGLRRHRARAAAPPHTGPAACGLIDASMDAIDALLPACPSAAVAWAGLSTLTPLLLQGMFQTMETRRCAAAYLVARIPWYTRLPEALSPSNWRDVRDFRAHAAHLRESIVALLEKVLELEMNCVLAAASTWCQAARSVAGRNDFVELLAALREADAQVASWVDEFLTSSARDSLLGCDCEELVLKSDVDF